MTNTSIPPLPVESASTNSVTTAPVQPSASASGGGRRKTSLQFILGVIALLVLLIGGVTGFILMSQSQDLRQQASGTVYTTCTSKGDAVCIGKTPGMACFTTEGQGNCVAPFTPFDGECDCQVGTVTNPTPTPAQCVSAGGSCSIGGSGASTCCSGLVCQNGVTGQLRCEDPGTTNLCPGGGTCGGAGGWLGFRCNQLTNGQCLENPQTFNDYASAAAYAGGCGQVDEVCVGGSNNRNLCGSFQIFSSTCGGNPSVPPSVTPSASPSVRPSVTPTPSPTPSPELTPSPEVSPSPSPALACMYIVANATEIRVGDDVTFTCGSVAGATAYEFRVRLPNGSFQPLAVSAAGSNISAPFSVQSLGDYRAQCRICTGPQQSCQEWEAL